MKEKDKIIKWMKSYDDKSMGKVTSIWNLGQIVSETSKYFD